jgi:hypothetical protein
MIELSIFRGTLIVAITFYEPNETVAYCLKGIIRFKMKCGGIVIIEMIEWHFLGNYFGKGKGKDIASCSIQTGSTKVW